MTTTPEREARYMRAYFHTFTPTGCDPVDAMLEAVALAGKAYHYTGDWTEVEWDRIQDRANEAAAALAASPAAGVPQPLTDERIEDCINSANRLFNGRRQGPSGQTMTTYDDWKYWLARAIERAHGIGLAATPPAAPAAASDERPVLTGAALRELAGRLEPLSEMENEEQVSGWWKHYAGHVRNVLAGRSTAPASDEREALPMPGSPEASAMIDSMLEARGWPASSKGAARAGYEAARRMLAARAPQAAADEAERHQADAYARGVAKGFEAGMKVAPQPTAQAEVAYTLDQIASACVYAEVSDGQFESMSIALAGEKR